MPLRPFRFRRAPCRSRESLTESDKSDNMIDMTAITATEAARRFSAILDESSRGAVFEVMRGGEHVATIMPPHRANGAAIIGAYLAVEPDEEFADVLEDVHRQMNRPAVIEDPWSDD